MTITTMTRRDPTPLYDGSLFQFGAKGLLVLGRKSFKTVINEAQYKKISRGMSLLFLEALIYSGPLQSQPAPQFIRPEALSLAQ